MSCHLHADTIADLARDVVTHSDDVSEARKHLARCASCAAHLARQRRVTADLRALAAATADARPSVGLKERLLEAYALQPGRPDARHSARVPLARSGWNRMVLFAEAAVLAGVAIGAWWMHPRDAVPPPDSPAAAANGVSPPPRSATPTTPPRAASVRSQPPRRAARPPAPHAEEFMAVPGSSALPELESGRIVRVALPVAALPAYGVEITPLAAQANVAADLLVGQDGHTRAIRLVRDGP